MGVAASVEAWANTKNLLMKMTRNLWPLALVGGFHHIIQILVDTSHLDLRPVAQAVQNEFIDRVVTQLPLKCRGFGSIAEAAPALSGLRPERRNCVCGCLPYNGHGHYKGTFWVNSFSLPIHGKGNCVQRSLLGEQPYLG